MTIVTWPITAGGASLLHVTTKPFTGELTLAVLEKFKAFLDGANLEQYGMKNELLLVSVPSILVDIANAGEQAVRRLGQITRGVTFGGAGLSEELGDMLTENGVNLSTGYGM